MLRGFPVLRILNSDGNALFLMDGNYLNKLLNLDPECLPVAALRRVNLRPGSTILRETAPPPPPAPPVEQV